MLSLLLGQAFEGMTIFSPAQGGGGGGGTFHTYLIDNDLNEINVWNHPRGAASCLLYTSDAADDQSC